MSRPPPSPADEESKPAKNPNRRVVDSLEGLAEAVGAVMSVAVGGWAAVVAALGQFALAAVLGLVALGMVLRLWRLRRRRRAARTAPRR